jgi:putative hemolysin
VEHFVHIVDELIYERAPHLVKSGFWWVIRPVLYAILGYKKAVRLSDSIADLGGQEALCLVSTQLSLNTHVVHLDRVPKSGRCVIVCNHPTGIADGIAVYDALKKVRNDAIFFANADALRVCPRFGEALIPVEWVETKRTREKTRATLIAAKQAFEDERCVVIFPAGRLATRGKDGLLSDPTWMSTAISLSQKYAAPIIPVHISGPNSFWFHFFARFSHEMRDITLFHEFLNKAHKRFDMVVGPVIEPQGLVGETHDLTAQIKTYVERRLAHDPALAFCAVEKAS